TPFLDELPPGMLGVGERVMVMPKYRGTGLVDELLECRRERAANHDVRIVFSACEPHLLSLYLSQGRKTYADKNINGVEAGYLIPLVSFPQGPDVLEALDKELGTIPDCVDRVLSNRGGAVLSPLMTPSGEYPDQIRQTLHEIEDQGVSAFHGFTDDEIERCLTRSNVIECAAGDRVLKKGGVARNIFVVLGGTLEVRDEERVVAVLRTGDVFGEMAFLLERPRVLDTWAATDSVRVLSLSESTLRKMIAEDPVVAAKLLMNLAKMLCVRLIKST
ncbi:MAG TPA: cyclic nucleotide-binding domain-containing protein, partial [Acidimicrobiia bacterium]